MSNPLKALVRLFGRSGEGSNPVVSALFTQAIGRPLAVHPDIGASLIDGYMHGAIDEVEPVMAMSKVAIGGNAAAAPQSIAVINVTGALVDRPMPGLCDDGPLSYEAIGKQFDAAMQDDSVSAVVFRMRSPGGMVDGCFDLTDKIHATRGMKPIVAVVDNMAYSAAFAIASTCDDIYVSRTGGVGSVGVFGYHVDVTEANAKAGIKVTLIYAGDHKVESNPHVQLSDEARAREQAVIDDMYGLFTASIAKYRGMDAGKVVATQAGTFNGQSAIDVGFATKLGTFEDAIADLAGSLAASDEDRAKKAQAAQAENLAQARVALFTSDAKPHAIAAAALIADASLTLETVPARIEHANAVVDRCHAAGDASLATEYIVSNTPLNVVSAQLQDMKAATAVEIDTNLSTSAAGEKDRVSWDATIAKFGGK